MTNIVIKNDKISQSQTTDQQWQTHNKQFFYSTFLQSVVKLEKGAVFDKIWSEKYVLSPALSVFRPLS